MNVLLLINSYRLGGAEKLAYDIAVKLAEYHDCHVFLCSMGNVVSELEHTVQNDLREKGINCHSLKKNRQKGRIKVIADLLQLIKDNNIDVVHTNGQSPDFYGRIARLINRKIKIVTTIHNTDGYSRLIEMIQQICTDRYTAVSTEAKQYAKHGLGVHKSIELIENGIDTDKYVSIKPNPLPFTVLSVGRMAEQKNYMRAADEIASFLIKHPDAQWIIYGDYSENYQYYGDFVDKINAMGITNSVKMMGVELNPEVIYKQATCFFLASSYEGFGIVFIEAMAVGIPVFARSVGVLQGVEKSGVTFYDIDKINVQDQLESLYNEGKESMNEQLARNQNMVQQKYSLSASVKRYFDIYSSCMEIQL